MSINTEYLESLVERFEGFSSPTDAQQLIIALGRKQGRSDDDNKTLAVLMRAEKKAEELAAARAKARKMLDDAKGAERKARTRRQIIWGAALLKAAQDEPHMAQLASLLFDDGYVAEKDKDAVRADYEALTASYDALFLDGSK